MKSYKILVFTSFFLRTYLKKYFFKYLSFLIKSSSYWIKNYPKEREVLELISKGYNYREIAEKLFISEETVISHRKHLLSKFKVRNSAELIRIAMENNLL